jgi:sialic acid synthase
VGCVLNKPSKVIAQDGVGVSLSYDGQSYIVGDYREFHIGGREITCATGPYVIAEIGHNHQGDVEICKQMFDAAKWAGVDAVKLQKRDNKTLYTEEFYNSPYNSENAFGATYGEHREALEFDRRQYELLKAYAESIGLTFFATAFDITSADFLLDLGCPALKLASGDLTNLSLLNHVRKTWKGKPVIFSTGGGTPGQIMTAHEILNQEDRQLCVMQCTSGYPAKYEELNLKVIHTFTKMFPNTTVGWSGHDTGIAMAPVAFSWGARVIEKHFTLNRAWKGTDQAFSLEPQGMKAMVDNLKLTRLAIGDGKKRPWDSETAPLTKQRKNEHGQISGSVGL